jgi:hypothetical protein
VHRKIQIHLLPYIPIPFIAFVPRLCHYLHLLSRCTEVTHNTILFMFLGTRWQIVSINISTSLARTQMFKRSNRRFLLSIENVIGGSSENLSTFTSDVVAQERKKPMTTVPTIQGSLLHQPWQSTRIRILSKTPQLL